MPGNEPRRARRRAPETAALAHADRDASSREFFYTLVLVLGTLTLAGTSAYASYTVVVSAAATP